MDRIEPPEKLNRDYLRKIAWVLKNEGAIGSDFIDHSLWVKIQRRLPNEHFPKLPAMDEDDQLLIVWMEGHRYLVSHRTGDSAIRKTYFSRLPQDFAPERTPFVLGNEKIEEIEITEYKEPEEEQTVKHARLFPQTDFTSETEKWLEENEIGEGCLPFRAVWYARQGEIIRHYEVEVPEGFKGWSEDEKGIWCRDKAHDLFGTHLTLSETEEEWGVDRIKIDTLEEAGFINENGTRHQIHRQTNMQIGESAVQ